MRYDGRWRVVAGGDGEALRARRRATRFSTWAAARDFSFTISRRSCPASKCAGWTFPATRLRTRRKRCDPSCKSATPTQLPFPDKSFDLVISITTLHNLHCYDLDSALREIERVGKKHKYIVVESYRNEEEKANLLYWQLTCEVVLHAGRMGVVVQANRLHRRLFLHLF